MHGNQNLESFFHSKVSQYYHQYLSLHWFYFLLKNRAKCHGQLPLPTHASQYTPQLLPNNLNSYDMKSCDNDTQVLSKSLLLITYTQHAMYPPPLWCLVIVWNISEQDHIATETFWSKFSLNSDGPWTCIRLKSTFFHIG